MEDMARLAVVEQSVRDVDKFNNILYELLLHISNILENPHDYELRTIKNDSLIDVFKYDAFTDYLKYIGFQTDGSQFMYPKELTLSNLRMAQAAIERKINFCYGKQIANYNNKSKTHKVSKSDLGPTKILTTTNPFLLKIEELFNHVLKYEDEELQALAREQIPLVTLQLMALDRVREQQKKIKSGEIKDHDLTFDVALLMELLDWFKYKFFSWVDKPPCETCDGPTILKDRVMTTSEGEHCTVEVYSCVVCGVRGGARFARYNSPRTLLRTRRGRCGEWANCFALLCRSVGYDTRYIYDTTDHVWCEVFDYDSKCWLHVDPCEAKLDAPLMYEHGWGKKLSYVIAVSRDDIQDVTWRYTLDHKQTLSGRSLCSEAELVTSLVSLRAARQRRLGDARRNYLALRTLRELVLLMQERKATDYESHGRISGSKKWRTERGEIGQSHTFYFTRVGTCSVDYCSGLDVYLIRQGGEKLKSVTGWATGVYRADKIFRKIEHDWKKVYLAREEGESSGSISWRFATSDKLRFADVCLKFSTSIYETATIDWTVTYDNNEPEILELDENGSAILHGCWSAVEVSARLAGGRGDVAWQHAQLYRADIGQQDSALSFSANVHKIL